ncbi:hypothetical protein BYI23_A025160 [Burkholderia sp. YI23]|nr:hypothetical protein BYI23_A025160 [Burkholderia sp. YI23]
MLRADAVSAREYGNCGALWSMVRDHDVPSLYRDASLFARALKKVSHKGTFRDVLTRTANRQSITLDYASNLFAVSIAYGFLQLDHRAELRAFKPLYLIN